MTMRTLHLIAFSLFALVLASSAFSHVHEGPFPPQFAEAAPEVKNWLRSQKNPQKPGENCCNEKDGLDAQEDVKDGHYRVLLPREAYPKGETPYWVDVPDDAVIKAPNLAYVPVAWYWHLNGRVMIRCFAPGAKL